MYSGQKLAHYLTDVQVSHVLLIRSIMVMLGAYIFGKIEGVDFSYS